jgi:hypothetical protein
MAVAHLALVAAVIWAFQGFRYQAIAPSSPAASRLEYSWDQLLGNPAGIGSAAKPPATARVLEFFREHRLLPEATIYGEAHAWKFSRMRSAFLNGQNSVTGWWWFFPYTFLVKTPLPLFGVIAFALIALWRRPDYDTIPLWILFAFYWAAAIGNPLNIGHRHILTTYPPLFVLCGAAARWLREPVPIRRLRVPGVILCVLMVTFALGTIIGFPNYLAYFNVLAGGRSNAYRHLVDSSLDWGQDLPALKRYIEGHPREGPAYLSYFGIASPLYYGIPARYLFSARGQDVPPAVRLLDFPASEARAKVAEFLRQHPQYDVVEGAKGRDGRLHIMLLESPSALRLGPGVYFVSATMLQPVMYDFRGPIGPWNKRYEQTYQLLYSAVKPLLGDNPDARDAALPALSPQQWQARLAFFEMYRFARLTAYLRQLQPVDNLNGSILVYRLSDADIARAFDGPPPELGPDLPVHAGVVQASQP